MNLPRSLPAIGQRVRLRPLVADDAGRSVELLQDPLVRKFLNRSAVPSQESLHELYQEGERLFFRKEAFYLAIEPASGGDLAGTIGIRFPLHPRLANLGYWLGREFWGKGWMSEAVLMASDLCFNQCFSARVDAKVRVGNLSSRRVLEKCGFRLDGTLRWNVPDGTDWADEWVFTRTRDQWEEDNAVRGNTLWDFE